MSAAPHPLVGEIVCWRRAGNTAEGLATDFDASRALILVPIDAGSDLHVWVPVDECSADATSAASAVGSSARDIAGHHRVRNGGRLNSIDRGKPGIPGCGRVDPAGLDNGQSATGVNAFDCCVIKQTG